MYMPLPMLERLRSLSGQEGGSRLWITCRGRPDGGGAQVHRVMSTMCFAHHAAMGYVHAPFSWVAHAVGDQARWTESWERFFDLGHGERRLDPHADFVVGAETCLASRELRRKTNVVVEVPYCHAWCDNSPVSYVPLLPLFRARYQAGDKSGLALHRTPGRVTVAVHVRRNDVVPSHPIRAARYTHNRVLLRTPEAVERTLRDAGLSGRLDIYSDGAPEEFEAFGAIGCHLHCREDVFATFHNLVAADILVAAKSSFSYVAALLNEGAKIYEPFGHTPLPGWIVRAPDGSFEARQLSLALEDVAHRSRR